MSILSKYTNEKRINLLMSENEKDIYKRYAKRTECGNDTPSHTKKTRELMGLMVDAFNVHVPNCFTENDKELLMQAAYLHDIGKLGVPVDILNKHGKPTKEEFDAIKQHPIIGHAILEHMEEDLSKIGLLPDTRQMLKYAKQMALCHHEKIDGTGYPNGLSGENIPLVARMMSVVDVLEALTAKRSYKDSMPFSKAESILREGAGTQFDAELIKVLLDNKQIVKQIMDVIGQTVQEKNELTEDIR